MTMDMILAAVGVLGALVAALSSRIRRYPLSEPLLGLLAGVLLGNQVSGLLPLPSILDDHALMHEAARLVLAVSVMSVALRYPIQDVRQRWRPVAVLLLIAMPLMALISTGLSWAVLGIPLAAAALLGAALCPTDPVLAASVVTGEPAEQDLPARNRQILSLESGANDGLALPFVLVAIAIAGPLTGGRAVLESLWEVFAAAAVGLVTGWLAGRALRAGEAHGAAEPSAVIVFTLVLAFGVLGLSGLIKADGIVAVFVAGLALNAVSTGSERSGAVSIDEAVNRFAVLPVFMMLGAMLPWAEWQQLGWSGIALALAVLALRRVPVLLLVHRVLRLRLADALFLGWFGPVGVAALFYLTMEASRLGVQPVVVSAGVLVVVLSTVAHGLTSAPGRALYRRVTAGGGNDDDAGSAAEHTGERPTDRKSSP